MRIVTGNQCRAGATLARPAVDGSGRIVFPEGAVLTANAKRSIESGGVHAVVIEDDQLDDVNVPELVPVEVHAHGVACLLKAVGELLQTVRNYRFEPLRAVQSELKSPDFVRRLIRSRPMSELEGFVRLVLDELSVRRPIDGLLSPIMPVSSLHRTVDSAILAAALARQARLDRDRQHQLALGMLLRDVGMVFVDPAALESPVEPGAETWRRIKHHPTLGFMIARAIAPNDVFAQTVILQHHERQDGEGYPRGLTGTNSTKRRARASASESQLTIEGEIAAVVDTYTAITSHRPYSPALAPDAAMREVLSQCGTALNSSLGQQFTAAVNWYPVLSRARITAGDHAGCSGYVISGNSEQPWLPTIRLLTDPDGSPMQPVDLDTSAGGLDFRGIPGPEPTEAPVAGSVIADEVDRIVDSRPVELVESAHGTVSSV